MKKTLAGLIAAGALLALAGGTMASFNASTTNPGNVLSNGSVTMTNVAGTIISGANCSTSTNNGTCATLFGTGNTSFKPGGPDATNTVTITYTGSLSPTSDFRLYAANYTSKAGANPLCTAANPGSALDLQVAVGASSGTETVIFPVQNATLSSALSNGSAYTSLSVSPLSAAVASGATLTLYSYTGGSAVSQQVVASAPAAVNATTISVNSFNANAAYPVGAQVLPGASAYGTLDGFATTYSGSATGLQLRGGANGSGALGAWATSDSSVFDVKVHLDAGATNAYQGCQSNTDLDWYAAA